MTLELGGITLHEFDVAATDFLLFLESTLFAWLLIRFKSSAAPLQRLFGALFAMLAIASLLGALYHAFFPAKTATPPGLAIWLLIGLSIGLASIVVWYIDALLLDSERLRRALPAFACINLLVFMCMLVLVSHQFKIIIAFYVPPMIALAVISFARWRRTSAMQWFWMFTGIVISFVAAALQFLRIGIHPVYFNHDAVYHVVQAAALAILFVSFLRVLRMRSVEGA